MANDTLQQQLPETGAPRDSRQVIQPVNYGGVFDTIKRVSADISQSKKDKEQARQKGVVTSSFVEALSYKQQQAESDKLEKEIQGNNPTVLAYMEKQRGGTATAEEIAFLEQNMLDVQLLKEQRKRLSPNELEIRLRGLQMDALTNAKSFSKEINAFFNKDFVENPDDVEDQLGGDFVNIMNNRWGADNWGPSEVAITTKEAYNVQTLDRDLKTGKRTVYELMSEASNIAMTTTRDAVLALNYQLKTQGALTLQQAAQFKDSISAMKAQALGQVDEQMRLIVKNKGLVGPDTRENLVNAINKEYDLIASLVDGKDAVSVINEVVKAQNAMIEMNFPPGFTYLSKSIQTGGFSGVQQLTQIMGDDKIRAMLTELQDTRGGVPALGEELNHMIANVFIATLTAKKIEDPRLRKFQQYTNGRLIKSGNSSERVSESFTDGLADVINTTELSAALKTMGDEEFANNYMLNTTPEINSNLSSWFNIKLASTANSLVAELIANNERIVRDPTTGEYSTTFISGEGAGPSQFSPGKTRTAITEELDVLNNLQRLHIMPEYRGIAPTGGDIRAAVELAIKLQTTDDSAPTGESGQPKQPTTSIQEAPERPQDIISKDARFGELGQIKNTDGTISTEYSITENVKELGGWVNIPTMVEGQKDLDFLETGKLTTKQRRIAIKRAIERVNAGASLPAYGSKEEALDAAKARTEAEKMAPYVNTLSPAEEDMFKRLKNAPEVQAAKYTDEQLRNYIINRRKGK